MRRWCRCRPPSSPPATTKPGSRELAVRGSSANRSGASESSALTRIDPTHQPRTDDGARQHDRGDGGRPGAANRSATSPAVSAARNPRAISPVMIRGDDHPGIARQLVAQLAPAQAYEERNHASVSVPRSLRPHQGEEPLLQRQSGAHLVGECRSRAGVPRRRSRPDRTSTRRAPSRGWTAPRCRRRRRTPGGSAGSSRRTPGRRLPAARRGSADEGAWISAHARPIFLRMPAE